VKRLFLALLLLSISLSAFAHEVRPAFLRITEIAAGEFNVVWKQPVLSGRRLSIKPTFPEDCAQTEPRLDRVSDTVSERFKVTCNLRQGVISLPGLENTLTDAFDDPNLALGGPAASPAGEYLRIGVDHIIFGWDHLLFVIGLTLLVGGRKVWGVATAFTLAHSITLAATALGGAALPSRPVEILIAGSIVLLGVEVLRKRDGEPTLGARRPYLIAFIVGLIHGFGFAGALADIGLPQGTERLALLLFNLGVELGQFAVIGLALAVLWGVTKIGQTYRKVLETITVYSFSTIAMFWVIQRVMPYFGSV
jgi:uncharacterized membrane protein YqjE